MGGGDARGCAEGENGSRPEVRVSQYYNKQRMPNTKLIESSYSRHTKQMSELTAQHEEDVGRIEEQLRRERDRATAEREHFESEIDAMGRIIKVCRTSTLVFKMTIGL